jgi:hypothetical protein
MAPTMKAIEMRHQTKPYTYRPHVHTRHHRARQPGTPLHARAPSFHSPAGLCTHAARMAGGLRTCAGHTFIILANLLASDSFTLRKTRSCDTQRPVNPTIHLQTGVGGAGGAGEGEVCVRGLTSRMSQTL